MTEVPEHLLRRSRERREALGLAEPSSDAPAAPAAAPAPAVAAPAAAAAAVEAAPPPPPEPPPPPRPRPPRSRIPTWVVPVLAGLPIWAFFYLGAFGERAAGTSGPNGRQLYSTSCASCHGAQGEGGVGPALEDKSATKTFPDEADHIFWVTKGSGPFAGKTYGAGTRVATGQMPPFGGSLSEAEIRAVVKYEREQL